LKTHVNTFQGNQWQQNEFGASGLDLYQFEARMRRSSWPQRSAGLEIQVSAQPRYDPVIGRWTSPDPLNQFYNNYTGMGNNPANFVDPDGRWLEALVAAAAHPGAQECANWGTPESTEGFFAQGFSFGHLLQSINQFKNNKAIMWQLTGNNIHNQMNGLANAAIAAQQGQAVGDAVSNAYVNDPKKGIQVHHGPKGDKDKDKTVSITNTSDEELDAALKASGDDPFVKEVVDAIKHMREADEKSGNDIFKTLTESKRETHVEKVNSKDDTDDKDQEYKPGKGRVYWDPYAAMYVEDDDNHPIDPKTDEPFKKRSDFKDNANQSPAVGLYHEMIHRTRHLKHPIGMRIIRYNIKSKKWANLEEKKVIRIENRATKIMDNEAQRHNYYNWERANVKHSTDHN
jgi:Effector protein